MKPPVHLCLIRLSYICKNQPAASAMFLDNIVSTVLCLQDGSDVLQFQRFRIFHPLPKQAHHGILKTLWDKRVQWNQGLNARRTKQLLQAFLDQDVRLGIPNQALPLPATAPRPAVTAAPLPTPTSATATVASTSVSDLPVGARITPTTSATVSPAKAAAGVGAAESAIGVSTAPQAQAAAKAESSPVKAAAAQSKGSARTQPWLRPRHKKLHTPPSDASAAAPLASTPVSNPVHEGKGHAGHALHANQGQVEGSQGQMETAPASGPEQAESALSPPPSPAQHSDSADFDSGTPATTSSQSDATNFESFDLSQAASVEQFGDGAGALGEDVLPNLPPLHLSKAQHRYSINALVCHVMSPIQSCTCLH